MKKLLAMITALVLCVVSAAGAYERPELAVQDREALLAALYEGDITSARAAIDRGLISCEELTGYYLERIEAYNEPYNCFITLCDNAMDEARARDAQLAAGEGGGALFGIPVVVKDNIHYAGYPTTNGRSGRLDTISEENAAIVDALLSEGAVIIGKTNMSTDAQDARASRSGAAGETKNAYSPYLASGGSSGGSAAAVSLNFAMAGLGTDTNSSLRYPAALNGCVSLRPTQGLLDREGLMILNSKRDTPGAITRTAADQAIMLDVLTGGEHAYADHLYRYALRGMRIGVLKEFAYVNNSAWHRGEEDLDDEIQAAFERAKEELRRCGAEVVDVSLPNIFSLSSATFDKDSAGNREKFYEAYQKLLTENDLQAVIFPSYLHAPQFSGRDGEGTSWNVYDQPYITNCRDLASCIGIPEISVPIGRHSRGAGIGMEIAGDKNAEQLLLNIAYSYTAQFDHRQAPEGAPNAYAAAYAGTMAERIEAYELSLLPPAEPELPEEPAADEEPEIPDEAETPAEPEEPVAAESESPGKWRLWLLAALGAADLAVIAWALLPGKTAEAHEKTKEEQETAV